MQLLSRRRWKHVLAQMIVCCVYNIQKYNSHTHTWQHSIHVWLMHRSVCTSPFTKEVETEWRNGKLEEGVDCPPTTYLSQCNFFQTLLRRENKFCQNWILCKTYYAQKIKLKRFFATKMVFAAADGLIFCNRSNTTRLKLAWNTKAVVFANNNNINNIGNTNNNECTIWWALFLTLSCCCR